MFAWLNPYWLMQGSFADINRRMGFRSVAGRRRCAGRFCSAPSPQRETARRIGAVGRPEHAARVPGRQIVAPATIVP
jgi:hypothetical protein